LRVVAEGVENEDEWKLLRRVGCDMAQGFYFARPFPAPELARWLADAYVDGTNVISVPSRAVSVV
jgi:EAL domain-containing protein (putative c-di-GMP-specific phosphodiesterase class I)